MQALLATGAEFGDRTRPRPPKGFDPTSPAAGYAARDRLHVTRRYPTAEEVTMPTLVDWCADLQPFATIHTWLHEHTG